MYATDREEAFIIRKLQRGLNSIGSWQERWNIKINEDRQAMWFIDVIRYDAQITLNERTIPFVNHVEYL
jgi:hypothetical protein